MSKKLVSALASFLALALLVPVLSIAFTASAEKEPPRLDDYTQDAPIVADGEEKYPTIILPGISQSVSYLADENGNPVKNKDGKELSGGLMIIDDSTVINKALKHLLFPALLTLITQKEHLGFTDKIYDFACDIFDIQASTPDGVPKQSLKTITFDTSLAGMSEKDKEDFYKDVPLQEYVNAVGEENVYLFAFPLLGTPVENGKNLQDYINWIKAETGAQKVNLAPLSLGGTVLTAWANYEHANYDDINKIINVVSLLNGTDIMGDFFARDFILEDQFINADFFPRVMKESSGDATVGYLINILLRIFPRAIFEKTLTRAVDGVLDTFILNAPQFWAMVPKERYPGLADRYLDLDKYPEKALLRQKTDAFYAAQQNLEANFLDMVENHGVKIYNICGYNMDFGVQNYNFFGIMKSSLTTNSDALIPIQSTSIGATAAPAGKQLDADYLAGVANQAYISPDKSLDASTCLFPDRVWFFRDAHHEFGRSDLTIEIAVRIITGEVEDIYTDTDKYPQFNTGRKTNDLTNRMRDVRNMLADPTWEEIPQEKLDKLVAVYNEAADMLRNTYAGDQAKTDKLAQDLRIAIADAKGETYTPPSTEMSASEKFAKMLSDLCFKTMGTKGFSDLLRK